MQKIDNNATGVTIRSHCIPAWREERGFVATEEV